ncbi:hypothetical protein GCM10018785_38660 [Streptomyces longispororuber]|uniref:Uncharacterized protein n=1 Tax=Streptomyces longispororuber TaxID=68230 RepID=A0A918ZSE3_9ACTN|nr:DUF6177 family protein [Streptomyces longispororuber]GHE66148.1 hypothetical protein GCM10018785_38660 [Streptomyces longispororuber]
MTKDVIALTPAMPDAAALVAGLHAGGPGLGVTTAADDAVIQLRSPGGRPLVSVEAPVVVHTPGEAQRLLGPEFPAPDVPFWWTEARASTALPEAEALAGSFCGRLTLLLGGTTWPPRAGTVGVVPVPDDSGDGGAHGDGSARTVGGAHGDGSARTVSGARGGSGTAPGPAAGGGSDAALPAVDVLTDSTAVVLADRPVIALTAWLSDVLRATAASGRALHIVTPAHARLSLPLRTALTGPPNRWVVQDPDHGYYDGLTGAVLHWRDGTFTPARTEDGESVVADAFAPQEPPAGHRLTLAFRTQHAPDPDLVLGRGLEAAWRHLTGAAPAGWGTAEPINLPWSTRQLTALARDRAPAPSHLLAVGHPDRPALATLRVLRTGTGVAQEVTLDIGLAAGAPVPLDAVEPLAETLVAGHGLSTLLVTLHRARPDLTVPARLEHPPVPVSFTLGAADVRAVGRAHAGSPPLPHRPTPLGPVGAPALHYRFGDGTDPAAWADVDRLVRHLEAARR